jgi:tetratricopeptide (TPR) repeat protein
MAQASLIAHRSSLIAALRGGLVLGLVGAMLWSIAATGPPRRAGEGVRLLRQGQFSAGLAALEGALAQGDLGAGQGAARLNLSYAYLARRDWERAGFAVQPLLDHSDVVLRARAWAQQGRIAAWAGRPAEAIAAWRTALRLAPAEGDPAGRARRAAQWHLAETAWQAGAAGAGAQFAALAALPAPPRDPYVAAAALRLAQIRATTEPRPDPALVTAVRAAGPPDLTLGDAPFLNLPGHDEGLAPETWIAQLDGLEAAVLEALALPDLSPASHAAFWGAAWVRMGEWGAATRLLERAVAADPTLADAHAYLGLAYQRTGATIPALVALQTAVELAPDRPLGHHLLARYYLAEGFLTRADQELDWLEVNGADLLVTLLDRARWLRLQGDHPSAEQLYLAAEQLAGQTGGAADGSALNPSLVLAQFYLEYAHWACANGRPAAERALAARPGPAEFDALGWATHLCYDDRAALPLLDQAARLAPRDPQIAYHQGVVLRALGRPAQARAALRRAADYDPGGPWERRALAAMSDE